MILINGEALGRLVFRRSSYRVPALSDYSGRPTHFETGNIAVMIDCLNYTKFHENRAIGSEVTAGSVRRLAYGYCNLVYFVRWCVKTQSFGAEIIFLILAHPVYKM